MMGACSGKVPTSILSQLLTTTRTSNYPFDVHDPLTSISNINAHFPNRYIFTLKMKAAGPTKVHINL
jgi:hypothetical protein